MTSATNPDAARLAATYQSQFGMRHGVQSMAARGSIYVWDSPGYSAKKNAGYFVEDGVAVIEVHNQFPGWSGSPDSRYTMVLTPLGREVADLLGTECVAGRY